MTDIYVIIVDIDHGDSFSTYIYEDIYFTDFDKCETAVQNLNASLEYKGSRTYSLIGLSQR